MLVNKQDENKRIFIKGMAWGFFLTLLLYLVVIIENRINSEEIIPFSKHLKIFSVFLLGAFAFSLMMVFVFVSYNLAIKDAEKIKRYLEPLAKEARKKSKKKYYLVNFLALGGMIVSLTTAAYLFHITKENWLANIGIGFLFVFSSTFIIVLYCLQLSKIIGKKLILPINNKEKEIKFKK